jgi:hypothetical protein
MPSLLDTFVCGDARLGPTHLNESNPVGLLVHEYDRFAGLCPGPFLAKFTNSAGNYTFPGNKGFQNNTAMQPINGTQTLEIGMLVDRFGSDTGRFLSPVFALYRERSLPPSSLNTNGSKFPSDYHVYRVVKPFNVTSGPIAPAFGQPGQGTQYFTGASRVVDLVNHTLYALSVAEIEAL